MSTWSLTLVSFRPRPATNCVRAGYLRVATAHTEVSRRARKSVFVVLRAKWFQHGRYCEKPLYCDLHAGFVGHARLFCSVLLSPSCSVQLLVDLCRMPFQCVHASSFSRGQRRALKNSLPPSPGPHIIISFLERFMFLSFPAQPRPAKCSPQHLSIKKTL